MPDPLGIRLVLGAIEGGFAGVLVGVFVAGVLSLGLRVREPRRFFEHRPVRGEVDPGEIHETDHEHGRGEDDRNGDISSLEHVMGSDRGGQAWTPSPYVNTMGGLARTALPGG